MIQNSSQSTQNFEQDLMYYLHYRVFLMIKNIIGNLRLKHYFLNNKIYHPYRYMDEQSENVLLLTLKHEFKRIDTNI